MQPLSREDSLSVVRSVLGDEKQAEPVATAIVDKGDGNPLFLEQLALHAGEDGRRQSAARVPDTIHDVVMARIDRLPEATKRLLQIAAVIGREFSQRLLDAVWPGPGPIEPHLRRLIRLEFIDERPESERTTYAFRHALVQETAYASLLERYRRVWHASVGQAIEGFYQGRIDEVAERLALHFGRSDESEKAVDYSILAAEKSQRRWANSEAVAYFDDALRRLDALPDSNPNRLRRIDAVLKQAEVKFALGQHAEHINALEQIRAIVEDAGDPRRRAAWHYWTGFLHSLTGSRPEVAIEHCSEASAIASAVGMEEIAAFATSCLTLAYVFAGRFDDALEAGQRAVAMFESRGDLWWAGRTLWHLSLAANALGRWDASLGFCRRTLDHGTAINDLRLKAGGWWRMGSAYIQRGDVAQGLECCEQALALAPIPYDYQIARAVRGHGLIRTGQLDAGIAELADAVAWFEGSRLRQPYLRCALWLAEGHLGRGEQNAARSLIADILNACRETGYRYLEGLACGLMGDCFSHDAPAAAEEYVETAMRIFEETGARNDFARALLTRAALRRAAGDIGTARALLERACEIFTALGASGEIDQAKSALAELNDAHPP